MTQDKDEILKKFELKVMPSKVEKMLDKVRQKISDRENDELARMKAEQEEFEQRINEILADVELLEE